LAFDGILSNSTKIRQRFILISSAFAIFSVLAILTLLTLFLCGWRTVSGWISLAIIQLTALSFTILALSFVLEIVGRLYQIEVRPTNTTIAEKVGSIRVSRKKGTVK
jgi:membrane glycosyltransferase